MTEINETTRMSTIEWRVVIALWKTASGKTETDFDAITQWSKTPEGQASIDETFPNRFGKDEDDDQEENQAQER